MTRQTGSGLLRRSVKKSSASKLASTDSLRRFEIDMAAKTLGLSRAMTYRLLARYRQDSRTSALLAETVGRRKGSLGLHRRVEAMVTHCIENFESMQSCGVT